jgi:hypothetical protein
MNWLDRLYLALAGKSPQDCYIASLQKDVDDAEIELAVWTKRLEHRKRRVVEATREALCQSR